MYKPDVCLPGHAFKIADAYILKTMSFLPKIFSIARCRSFISVSQASRRYCSTSVAVHQIKDITADVTTLKTIWKIDGCSDECKDFLWERFSSETNTFSYLLNLISMMPNNNNNNKHKRSPDIALGIIFSFNDWLKVNNVNEELTFQLKRNALETVLPQKNVMLTQIVCDIFKIQEHKMDFKGICDILIAEEKYEEATLCVCALGLQEEFPLEAIVLPLAYNRQAPKALLHKYFQGHDELFLKYLKHIDDHLGQLQEKPVARKEGQRTTPFSLFKFINGFVNQYSLNIDEFPNTRKIKKAGMLNFFIRKKLENSIPENWEENVSAGIGDDLELQRKFIGKLVKHNDTETAFKFAKLFNLPSDDLSIYLKSGEFLNQSEGDVSDLPATNGAEVARPEYYKLELNMSQIIFIATPDEFFRCLEDVSQNMGIIGLDSEWKPQFDPAIQNKLSLLQLATRDKVYILDILALKTCLLVEHWDFFMQEFIANPTILKLGCGIVQDLQMLVEFYNSTKKRTFTFSNFLDLPVLYQKMENLYNAENNLEENSSNTKGLSKLCEIILGKPLNKVERHCDWEQRPLTDKQLTYAALDAYCLIQMYDSMKKFAEEEGRNFNNYQFSTIYSTTVMAKMIHKSNKHLKWVRNGQAVSFRHLKAISDFRVIVESELTEIITKLRMYGVDVLVMSAEEIYKNSFQVLRDEDRILIGTESLSNKVKGELSSEKYYLVPKEVSPQYANNVTAPIFLYFNVQMNSGAIFSRCVHCNGNEFVQVSSDILKELMENQSKNNSSTEDQECPEVQETSDSNKDLHPDILAKINVDKLNPKVLSKVETFKVCAKCGNLSFQR